MLSPADHLGSDGALARLLPGFAPRPQQQAMARAVEEALTDFKVLVCEAGTGTGKTFAYLVPALLSGRRVIISTGTKSLQEQLFHRDLPLVRRALAVSAKVALLKGRANYLCRHRLTTARDVLRSGSADVAGDLVRIGAWAGGTRSGDIAEVPDIPEDAPVWRQVTSTAENCLGQDCPELSDCHVLKARRAAADADLVVVNHHLFFADMALRDEGFGELLPGADAVILDEAHQLPEVASQFFGLSLGSRHLAELARDSVAAYRQEAGDDPGLPAAAHALEQALHELRLGLGVDARRGAWQALRADTGIANRVDALRTALDGLKRLLEQHAERGKDLQSCHRRCADLIQRMEAVTGPPDAKHLQWFETHVRSFSLNLTPLDIADVFSSQITARRCAWVFTSATLAVGRSFEHFAARMGLSGQAEGIWDSPFDFSRQALCYVPGAMPDPNSAGYTARVVDAAVPVLEASRGRAFLLFTSHRALREAASSLAARVRFPLLVQGQAPRTQLLQRFRNTPNAVLLGTSSFWEGIDVRGETLSCVIIDKLPFASPDDPVLQARLAAIREQGGNPFFDYQLPRAVIALKQGVGRLIRDVSDRGILVLCDPRLFSRSYGRVFLDSLPPLPIIRDPTAIVRFFGGDERAASG